MKRSARNLVQACEAEQAAATSWCAAYLMGIADTLTAFGEGGHKGGLCGASYTIADVGEIFLAWMRAHPQFLDIDMLAGASLSLRERWPCR
nr:Rap1a/Tai family immunity protein [Pannonibacter phragmitetus]